MRKGVRGRGTRNERICQARGARTTPLNTWRGWCSTTVGAFFRVKPLLLLSLVLSTKQHVVPTKKPRRQDRKANSGSHSETAPATATLQETYQVLEENYVRLGVLKSEQGDSIQPPPHPRQRSEQRPEKKEQNAPDTTKKTRSTQLRQKRMTQPPGDRTARNVVNRPGW